VPVASSARVFVLGTYYVLTKKGIIEGSAMDCPATSDVFALLGEVDSFTKCEDLFLYIGMGREFTRARLVLKRDDLQRLPPGEPRDPLYRRIHSCLESGCTVMIDATMVKYMFKGDDVG
jgi:hypothetical protein